MQKLVVVAEDHPDTREMICEVLSVHGYLAEPAVDGVEALESVRALHPAAILMDVAMPRKDGITATQELHADPTTRDIPVIGLTGQGPEAQAAMLRAGATRVCAKPCDFDQILAILERATAG